MPFVKMFFAQTAEIGVKNIDIHVLIDYCPTPSEQYSSQPPKLTDAKTHFACTFPILPLKNM